MRQGGILAEAQPQEGTAPAEAGTDAPPPGSAPAAEQPPAVPAPSVVPLTLVVINPAADPQPKPQPAPAPEVDILSLIPPELLLPAVPAQAGPLPAEGFGAVPPAGLRQAVPAPASADRPSLVATHADAPAAVPAREPAHAPSAFAALASTADEAVVAVGMLRGFVGAALVDSETGLLLATHGGDALDLEATAALDTEVIRAQRRVLTELGLDDRVEDILVTTGRYYHVLRPLEREPDVFLYVALDRHLANLGMVRRQLGRIEAGLVL